MSNRSLYGSTNKHVTPNDHTTCQNVIRQLHRAKRDYDVDLFLTLHLTMSAKHVLNRDSETKYLKIYILR